MIKWQCPRIPIAFLPALLALLEILGRPPIAHTRDRLPLQKKNVEIGQPAPVSPEFEGYDKDGKPIYWDPKPRVAPLGGGKYAFKWFGHSGRQLTLIYERPDAVDAVVAASALPLPGGSFRYEYRVRNLESSDLDLGGFMVRILSRGAEALTDSSTTAVNPWRLLKQDFPDGAWVSFQPVREKGLILPGEWAHYALVSPDLPGLADCRAFAGNLTMQGVGEEPPTVLENLYLRNDAWPHGWTIGPDERLAKMSLRERLDYLVEKLPKMLELGWIDNEKVMGWYEMNLKAGKTAEVRARADADFKRKLITSEVLALMTYLTR
jgi:hypothetical protein